MANIVTVTPSLSIESPEDTLSRLMAEETTALVLPGSVAVAPPREPETVVKAYAGNGDWGTAGFHNLTEGARASGTVYSAHSLLSKADLDWDPVLIPLRTADGLSLPRDVGQAVIRSDTRAPIGCVGDRYTPIPHRKLADLADALSSGEGLRFGNAGHKQNGARPFIQLESAPRIIGREANVRGIETFDRITLMTSHDGSLRMVASYGACVICCDNTYAHALGQSLANGISIRHTASGLAMVEEAIKIGNVAKEYAFQFDNAALRLMVTRLEELEMRKLASSLIPGEGTRGENSRRELMDAWVSSPGALPGTAWGAAQAVTHYTSHTIGTRGGTDRAFALATGEGRGSEMQSRAWWHLTTGEGRAALQTVEVLAA